MYVGLAWAWERAARLFEHGLEMELPEADFWLAIQRLSRLQKRRGDMETAVVLWERAAAKGHVYAHVELAKYYEHTRRDYVEALRWTASAAELVSSLDVPRRGARRQEGRHRRHDDGERVPRSAQQHRQVRARGDGRDGRDL